MTEKFSPTTLKSSYEYALRFLPRPAGLFDVAMIEGNRIQIFSPVVMALKDRIDLIQEHFSIQLPVVGDLHSHLVWTRSEVEHRFENFVVELQNLGLLDQFIQRPANMHTLDELRTMVMREYEERVAKGLIR